MRPTMADLEAFCNYHGLPVPDSLVRTAEGGIDFKHPERYSVVELQPVTPTSGESSRREA